MRNPYGAVLAVPGAPAFAVAGLVARLPISMLGIGIVLLVEGSRGSYAAAGAVAAVYTVVQAVCSPQVARLVDRYGQARVMRPAIAVHVSGLVLLVVLTTAGAPLVALFAAAVLMGSTIGSIGALVRARWSHVLTRPGGAGSGLEARVHTAFSLESVFDEVVFVVGPLLVTVLAVEASPAVAMLAAGAAVALGGAALFAQRGTEPPPSPARPPAGSAVLRAPGMVVLAAVFVAVGGVFGSVEVVTVAFAEERGAARLTGAVLAAYAAGSLLAGLAYGAVQWRTPPGRRFLLGVLGLGAGMLPVALVTTVPLLAVALVVAGMAISPTIIAGNALVRELVDGARLTEGLTWISTALGIGVSAGAALAGQAIDAAGARPALLLPVAAGVAAALLGLAGSRWILHPRRSGARGR